MSIPKGKIFAEMAEKLGAKASALSSNISKTHPHLLSHGKINVGFESIPGHGAPRAVTKHLPKAPTLHPDEIKTFGAIGKGEIAHTPSLPGGIPHPTTLAFEKGLDDIGHMADIAHHLPGGTPHRMELYELQAQHLLTHNSANATHLLTGIGHQQMGKTKWHLLRDETVAALEALPPEKQARVMHSHHLNAAERKKLLDPHGTLIGNELENRPLLQDFATHIHENFGQDLPPENAAALKRAIDGSQRRFESTGILKDGKPTGMRFPSH